MSPSEFFAQSFYLLRNYTKNLFADISKKCNSFHKSFLESGRPSNFYFNFLYICIFRVYLLYVALSNKKYLKYKHIQFKNNDIV